MKTEEFEKWLFHEELQKRGVVQSRISNCRRVEQYYNNLDVHFQNDGGNSLIELLRYSSEDQRNKRPTQHIIPIDGDKYDGSATLKSAVNLYMRFCRFKRDNSGR